MEDVLPSVTGVPPLLGRAWGVLISVGPQQLFEGEGTSFLGPPLLFQSLYPKCALSTMCRSAVREGCPGLRWRQLSLHTVLGLLWTLDFLSLRQFRYWSYVAPSSFSAIARLVPVYPLGLPGITFRGTAVGFWSLCSQKGENYFCKSTHPFCTSQLCVCQEV